METFSYYEKFFTLREKYPKHKKLIGEIMQQFFFNKDALPSYFYIVGVYKTEDIRTILKELGINSFDYGNTVKGLTHPEKYQTNIFLSEETELTG